MLQELRDVLYRTVRQIAPEENLAVAFSGGVDSSLLARICADIGKQITLVTVGFPGSHDIGFSRRIAARLGIAHRIIELDAHGFEQDLERVYSVITCNNTSHVENCVAYLCIARAAKEAGIRVVLSANGCDELFRGYDAFRSVYDAGERAVMKFMEDKILSEMMLVEEISLVAQEYDIEVRQPFLSPTFIEYAKAIPLDQKIKGADDRMRKHILRQVALEIGIPQESAMKPKKALQYGSLIHKNFRKKRYEHARQCLSEEGMGEEA